MRTSRTARSAVVTATAVAVAALLFWPLVSTAGAVLPDGLRLPTTTTSSTTTTTSLVDPTESLGDVVESIGEVTASSTTTTPTPTTTTTTAPPAPTPDPDAEPAPEPTDNGGTQRGGGTVTGGVAGGTTSSTGSMAEQARAAGAPRGSHVSLPGVAGATSAHGVRSTQARAGSIAITSMRSGASALAPGSSVRPSFGRSTAPLLASLDPLGLPPSVLARVLAPFPVAGRASYSADFGTPRTNPRPHTHEGTDVFASSGTPVIASADGVVGNSTVDAAVSGTSLRLTSDGGTYFFYAHLLRFAHGVSDGSRVAKGDVLGFVGTSGNAEGTPPHVHFEIHPQGGEAVDPVPYLDQWLADAALAANALEGAGPSSLRLPSPRSTGGRPGAATRSAAPAQVDLTGAQTISASGAGPGALLVLLAGGTLAVKRLRRHRARVGLR